MHKFWINLLLETKTVSPLHYQNIIWCEAILSIGLAWPWALLTVVLPALAKLCFTHTIKVSRVMFAPLANQSQKITLNLRCVFSSVEPMSPLHSLGPNVLSDPLPLSELCVCMFGVWSCSQDVLFPRIEFLRDWILVAVKVNVHKPSRTIPWPFSVVLM